jgi:cytochrome b561/polyisoprenoid-binding protein YceI
MSTTAYSQVARYLHWIVAGLVALQFVLAQWAESLEESNNSLGQLAVLANHKSVGMTIFMLALLRLGWRLMHPAPPLVATMPVWQQKSAHIAHWLFYVLLFALPFSGWLMSSATAYSVSWFNQFTFPDLVAADPGTKEIFEIVHESLAKSLFVLGLGHIGAALWHHFRDHDDTLRRMLSPGAIGLAVALLVAGIWQLTAGGRQQAEVVKDVIGADSIVVSNQQMPVSTLPMWAIDYESSTIEFTAEQAGAPFTGIFSSWRADIQFDPEQLDNSVASVTIELASVDTKDTDRDETLAQAEWFAGGTARFQASEFARLKANEYQATNATLAFSGLAHPVVFTFSQQSFEDKDVLTGHARLDRLALGVGTGDWSDTTWVGGIVEVDIRVEAAK